MLKASLLSMPTTFVTGFVSATYVHTCESSLIR
jgi:hypothetical protein